MSNLLHSSTRALMCSKDGHVVDRSTNDQTLTSILNARRTFEKRILGSVAGRDLKSLQDGHYLGYSLEKTQVPYVDSQYKEHWGLGVLDNNNFSFYKEIKLLPFATINEHPASFNNDRFYALEEDEMEPLKSEAFSIVRLLNGTSLREALQLSDNNFVDALGLGISSYSWLGGDRVSSYEDLLQWVSSIIDDNYAFNPLIRTTESSMPTGDYKLSFLQILVSSTYLYEESTNFRGFTICSDGSGIRGVRKLWSREILLGEPVTLPLSLHKSKSANGSSKSKARKCGDAVVEEELELG